MSRSAHALIIVLLCLGATLVGSSSTRARSTLPTLDVGINEKLGAQVPGNIAFVNEKGDTVKIGDLIDRPTIVSLVYYNCPSICRPLLDEVTNMLGKLEKVDTQPDRDYRMVTISFDETDSPAGSARFKEQYYHRLPAGYPADAWTFLTGDSASIAAFTQAVGFAFKRNPTGFAHPTTLVVLSKNRTITRYLTGSEYLPLDIKMALVEAREGRIGPTIAKFYKFCFSYDPKGEKFVLNATRVVGVSTLLGVVAVVAFVSVSGRRREKKVH